MNESIKGWIASFVVAFLWGSSSVLAKFVLEIIGVNLLVLLQYALAVLTLGLIILYQKKKGTLQYSMKWRNLRDGFSFVFGGVVGQTFFSALSFLSLRFISPSESGIIQALIPIFILAIGFFVRKASFTKGQFISALFALAGVWILISESSHDFSGVNSGHIICFFLCSLFFFCGSWERRVMPFLRSLNNNVLPSFFCSFFLFSSFLFFI